VSAVAEELWMGPQPFVFGGSKNALRRNGRDYAQRLRRIQRPDRGCRLSLQDFVRALEEF